MLIYVHLFFINLVSFSELLVNTRHCTGNKLMGKSGIFLLLEFTS